MQKACPKCGSWAFYQSSDEGYMAPDDFMKKHPLVLLLGLIIIGIAIVMLYKAKH